MGQLRAARAAAFRLAAATSTSRRSSRALSSVTLLPGRKAVAIFAARSVIFVNSSTTIANPSSVPLVTISSNMPPHALHAGVMSIVLAVVLLLMIQSLRSRDIADKTTLPR